MNKKLRVFIPFVFILLLTGHALAKVKLTEIVKKVQPAVVTILAYDKDKEPLAQGSGFFVDSIGYIVTNYHVLEGAMSAEVKTYDGNTYPVILVVGENESKDLIKLFADIPKNSFRWLDISKVPPDVAEEIVVVGIAYNQGNKAWWSNRARDYLPTKDSISELGKQWPMAGGALNFIHFIGKELFPEIETRYNTSPMNRGIAGFSFGGLLASYILLTHSHLFQNYIIISPGLSWDDHLILKEEMKYNDTHENLEKRLFVTLAANESQEWIINSTKEFIKALKSRNYSGLDLHYEYYEGETHFSGYSRAFTNGLKHLYPR